jgi:hypothetical protein
VPAVGPILFTAGGERAERFAGREINLDEAGAVDEIAEGQVRVFGQALEDLQRVALDADTRPNIREQSA